MRNEVVSDPNGSVNTTNGALQGVDILATGKGQPPPYWPATPPMYLPQRDIHGHCTRQKKGCGCMTWREGAILVTLIKSIMTIAGIIYLAIAVKTFQRQYENPDVRESEERENPIFWILFMLIIVAAIQLIAWLLGLYGAIKRHLVSVKICFATNGGIAIGSFILFLASLAFSTSTLIITAPSYVVEAVCLFVVGKYYYEAIHQQECLETTDPTYQRRI